MKASVAIVFCLVVFAGRPAFADAGVPQPRLISRSGHPAASPTKASSLAPRAHSKKRVYGAPIQRPILTSHTSRATSTRARDHDKPNSP
jgi:hypothetical protein